MSSYNKASRKVNMQDGRIVMSGRHVTIAHNISSDKDYVLRGAAAMTLDFSKLSTISGKKNGEPLDDPVCVCGFREDPFGWTIN